MRQLILTLLALAWVLSATQQATAQDDKKAAELEKKVAELEKKVAKLEAALKVSPKPEVDLKLIGNWANPQEKGQTIVALRFEADGTGRMVTRDKEDTVAKWYIQYEVTGKVIEVKMSNTMDFNAYSSINITILSVDAKQLTMKNDFYAKGAEMKLDKQ